MKIGVHLLQICTPQVHINTMLSSSQNGREDVLVHSDIVCTRMYDYLCCAL